MANEWDEDTEMAELLETFEKGNFSDLDRNELVRIASHYKHLWKEAEAKLGKRLRA
jgi:hypothetical protein